ncbi:Reverse transcriptase (RNA-dependent DNA polymerase) [Popillia japonica]|uniref:Reverse transcriptase (RNA-dependent DNA polymerase) n=1 Tax=Popillia japonica TaxID=7064 RepID=A0AAW1JH64_POPJA
MNGTRRLIIAVYVDDLLILSSDNKLLLSSDNKLLETTKQRLQQKLKIKDLGVATEILGIRIARDFKKGTLQLDQSSYIEKILNKFNMNGCKPVTTPADPNAKLDGNKQPKEDVETEEIKNVPYQEAIGSLLFLCHYFYVKQKAGKKTLDRGKKNFPLFEPERRHWTAVKRIFRYLRGTTNLKLEFRKDKEQFLEAYSDADWANELDDRRSITGNVIKFQHDADWANELDDRRSITGNVIKFQHGAISWSSKKQKTVALSTTEAEYMGLSTTCQEVLWLRMLAQEIDATAVSQPTIVYCDNKSAIDLAETSAYRQRTKHIDVRHHFLREKIEDGEISINHIPTDEMTADSLTKPLFKQKHETCAKNMGLVTSINICSRGSVKN